MFPRGERRASGEPDQGNCKRIDHDTIERDAFKKANEIVFAFQVNNIQSCLRSGVVGMINERHKYAVCMRKINKINIVYYSCG